MSRLLNLEDREDALRRIRELRYRTTMAGCTLEEAKLAADTILQLMAVHRINQIEVTADRGAMMTIRMAHKPQGRKPHQKDQTMKSTITKKGECQ